MSTIISPYPENCFTKLVGIRGVCEPKNNVTYWLDDMPGIDLKALALTATSDAPSGSIFGQRIIETAARFMAADVLAIYDGKYKIENNLVAGCSTCKFLTNYASGTQRGITIKDLTMSSFSHLVIDKLTAKLNDTGTFNIRIDDGDPDNLVNIEHDFTAGVEYNFNNLDYATKKKVVRVYLLENNVPLAQLSCPRPGGSNCGCGGKAKAIEGLTYTGTSDGAETQNAYGFIPCASIRCDGDDLLCFVANSAPRMIGMALLFKVAELYFTSNVLSTRQNKVVGQNSEDKVDEQKRYNKLYLDRINGKGVRGVKDLVFGTLGKINDSCVVCDTLVSTQWATT